MNSNQTPTTQHEIAIKNMVSKSCVELVKVALSKESGIHIKKVQLGGATFQGPKYTDAQINALLQPYGFELLSNASQILIEHIKIAVLEMIFYGNNLNTIIRNSDYLSDKLGLPYGQLSKSFSEETHQTLEKYIILVKIERVKELLSYNNLTLSEIAYQMGYSSVQYLSNQFKQITGYSVSEFKGLKDKPRTSLDELI